MELKHHLLIAFDKWKDREIRLYHALAAIAELNARQMPATGCDCAEHFPAEVAVGWRCPCHGKHNANT